MGDVRLSKNPARADCNYTGGWQRTASSVACVTRAAKVRSLKRKVWPILDGEHIVFGLGVVAADVWIPQPTDRFFDDTVTRSTGRFESRTGSLATASSQK